MLVETSSRYRVAPLTLGQVARKLLRVGRGGRTILVSGWVSLTFGSWTELLHCARVSCLPSPTPKRDPVALQVCPAKSRSPAEQTTTTATQKKREIFLYNMPAHSLLLKLLT